MDRQTIEAKDQRLIKKFRAIVADKEFKAAPKRSLWPRATGLAVMILALAASSYVYFSEKPHGPGTASVNTPVTDQATDSPEPSEDSSDAHTLATLGSPVEDHLVEPQTFAPPKPEPVPVSIRISGLVTCSRVENRQYIAPKSVFSLTEESVPVVWMTVVTDTPPLTLTHVYYHEGRRYCSVPLRIDYPRTRTWSHVTLNPSGHLGSWRVDVVNDRGDTLGHIDFTVVL